MTREKTSVEIHRCDECGATWRSDQGINNTEFGYLTTYGYHAWKGLNLGRDFCSPECLRDHVERALRTRSAA